MSFINRIKKALHPRTRHGCPRGKVVVDEKDLQELVHHFESMDSSIRLDNAERRNGDARHILHCAIQRIWFDTGENADVVTLEFSQTMRQLLVDKLDREEPRFKLRRDESAPLTFQQMYLGEFKPDERMEALRNRYIQYYKDTNNCTMQMASVHRKELKQWIQSNGYTPEECSQVKKSIGPTAKE